MSLRPFLLIGGHLGTYFRTNEMVSGGPFRCYNCGKILISKVKGEGYEIDLFCPRCKATIIVKMREKLPYNKTKDQEREDVQATTAQMSPV